jgi:hypothetical protein
MYGLTITGTSTPTLQAEEPAPFNPAQIREFTPQGYDMSNSVSSDPSPALAIATCLNSFIYGSQRSKVRFLLC